MRVTIIMYHYVRDAARSRYPGIKALAVKEFDAQITYITRHYNVITGEDLMAAVDGKPLPPKAALLTFDDGYIDHFTEVYPLLIRERVPACFFPVARCIRERAVLDVNKVQFILAAASNVSEVVQRIREDIEQCGEQYGLKTAEEYWLEFGQGGRFDPPEVMFVKSLLQRELPAEMRQRLVGDLFRTHVTADEESFSLALYASKEQLSEMRDGGMYIGSHGYEHCWMNALPEEKQALEVERSLSFLGDLTDAKRWIMCYPYGAHNAALRSIIVARGCVAGLTTEVGIASTNDDPLMLPRLDTNDLPKILNTPPCPWTIQA